MSAEVPSPIPIIIGVAGHRKIDWQRMTEVRANVRCVLQEMHDLYGAALHVMTALAEGADRFVAEQAIDMKIPIIVVLPMPKDSYLNRMCSNGRTKFEFLWPKAALTLTLPDIIPTGQESDPDYDTRQYLQLAAFLARRSHLLLALWDGTEDAASSGVQPKPGGTADVIHLRTDMGYAAKIERTSALFGHSGSPLDALRPGAVLSVATPRCSGIAPLRPGSGLPVAPGACFMLQVGTDPQFVPPCCDWLPLTAPTDILNSVGTETKRDFERLGQLNEQIAKLKPAALHIFRDQLRQLKTAGIAPPNGHPVYLLKQLQAASDTVAFDYQRRLIGSFSAIGLGDLRAKSMGAIAKARKQEGFFPWPNVLGVYGILIPGLVILFETYSIMHWGPLLLLAYLLISPAAFIFYHFRVVEDRWQDKWQDYRALAEALRVQLYWSVSGVPLAAGDSYLRKQDGELGWIKFALQGPAIWSTANALTMNEPNRAAVIEGWMDHQALYFLGPDGKSGKAKQNHEAADRNKRYAKHAYVLGIVFGVLVLVPHILEYFPLAKDHCAFAWLSDKPHNDWYHRFFEVATVTMPAFAAFLTLATNQRAYEAHARSYWQMGTAFRRAHTIAKSIPPNASADSDNPHDLAFKQLVRELGRESLAETAEWLMDHRDRRVEPPS